ncbi:uncharacterized protein PFL1_03345 [Pseudozyma flocculosa PF-1]|uniref:Uncharacterized protein n=2 Tax=Pseudozyma flocculosa TaxID=84751 RepID=A0A5C3F796_9BASI|nr:uncharacterized protein PFL1_03345 [Pseudozyma flocculosa PF-1]EPQ29056.1 hypothetical protein PFL1_03345 [Pseudozyma flocculosa PF-1]SPO40050.1 uncharacterized protein PSFLO_05532 [Pseudozyma flocculosa]
MSFASRNMLSTFARSFASTSRTSTVPLATAMRGQQRFYSARPDLASGQRDDHAHGPIPGAHPSPEINVARTRSTIRVLVPSVSLMLLFIGWWFLGHDDRDHRKARIDVGPDADNKLKGSKHRAALQLQNGERNELGEKIK